MHILNPRYDNSNLQAQHIKLSVIKTGLPTCGSGLSEDLRLSASCKISWLTSCWLPGQLSTQSVSFLYPQSPRIAERKRKTQ